MAPAAAAATQQQLQEAVAAGADEQAARLLEQLAGQGPLLGTTFASLAAAGLARAAVRLAQLESGSKDLREADATEEGGSYLHAAAAAGAGPAVIAALVASGCALEGHDDTGATPLHVAAAAGHEGTCHALLEAGADALARNGNGRTPRMQGGVPAGVKALLAEAEEAGKARRAAKQAALWDDKLRATQTESACRLGCL